MGNNILEIKNADDRCTGCGACSSICPVGAISMEYDEEGFLYPVVNDTCVFCGKCVNICNMQAHSKEKKPRGRLLWCYSKDEQIRKTSSSGGVFYELAKEVIASEGIVCGAATNDDLSVSHRMAEKKEDLVALQRSKYVQSEMRDSFLNIKKNLDQNRLVLFVGTPCQVDAVKRSAGDEHERLVTVDFVCHGVPSTRIYRDMISYYEHKKKNTVSNVTFREKDLGWRRQALKIYFSDGTFLLMPSTDTVFYYSFLKSQSLRKSCYTCQYASNHQSDITMADFWGTKEKDDRGISLLSINTEKGQKLFDRISSRLVVGEADCVDAPLSFVNHTKMQEYDIGLRTTFFLNYRKNGYGKLQKKMRKVILKRKFDQRARRFVSILARIKKDKRVSNKETE